MRILTIGDSPHINSGYGNILRKVNEGLIEAGHEVSMIAWFQMRPVEEDIGYEITHVTEQDPYGIYAFNQRVFKFKADVVFSVCDPYALVWVSKMVTRDRFAFCYYVPVDSVPIPSFWRSLLVDADNLFTYTNFGKEGIKKAINRDINVVYPGYDSDVFKRLEETKEEVKKRNGFSDRFIFTYVGVNAIRKQPVRLLKAFSKVIKKHPEAMLYLHTTMINEREGWNLEEAARQLGISPGNLVFSRNSGPHGVPPQGLNIVYNLSDCMVSGAMCEGFGLPILEAAAVGVPSIGMDYSSMPELIKGRGELVKARAWTMHNPYCQQRPLIDEDSLASKMNKMIENPKLLEDYSKKCLEWASQYSWENQLPKFLDTITSTERERKEDTGRKEIQLIVV